MAFKHTFADIITRLVKVTIGYLIVKRTNDVSNASLLTIYISTFNE